VPPLASLLSSATSVDPGVPVGTYLPHFFFLRATAALSTRFGYGLPAALAFALAAVFCAGVNLVDFFFGFS